MTNVGFKKGEITETIIKDTTANPAPLGLMGFGLTTILLNLHNSGLFGIGGMILAMGIFYGGIAQIIAGIMEWKKNNTFGTTAFTSYGSFWLTLVALIVLPKMGLAEPPTEIAMAAYLFLWGVFTTILFFATLKLNKATQVVFFLLALLFFLLSAGDATGNVTLKHFAGYEGILTGLSAVYAAAAQIINEAYGKTILPLGE